NQQDFIIGRISLPKIHLTPGEATALLVVARRMAAPRGVGQGGRGPSGPRAIGFTPRSSHPMRTYRHAMIGACVAALALSAQAPRACADSVTAVADSIIQPAGPRTQNGGTTLVDFFFNAEGSGNGTNASFAVADFSGLRLGISSLSQLSQLQLSLTEDNAAF